jgi:hypothetical protein
MTKRREVIWMPGTPRNFAAVIDIYDSGADFWLLEVTCWRQAPEDTRETGYTGALFTKMGLTGPETESPEEAIALEDPIVVKGYIKWDGCSNFEFREDHICDGSQAVVRLARAWVWCLNECHRLLKQETGLVDWEPATL